MSATVADIRKKLEKRYKDSTELFPDFTTIKQIDVIKSPSAIINVVTGVGGFPRSRLTEIHGPYSSGKTTIAIEVAVTAQNEGGIVLFLDYEHAFDATYAHNLGLDLSSDKFIFAQPEYFEQGARIIEDFLVSDTVDMIVIDSAAAMTPRSELEGEIDSTGGTQKGVQAALMAQFLTRVTKQINRGRKPALVVLNQTRAAISIGGRPQKNAPKEQPAGGMALKFYSSIRLSLEIVVPEGDSGRGTKATDQLYTQNRVRVTCIKNKLAPPWIRGQLVIEFGKGINNLVSIAELAEAKLDIMSGSGYFNYVGSTEENTFSCRGRDAFLAKLKESPAIQQEIEDKVLQKLQDEQAAALGIDKIVIAGKAKEMDGNTMILDDHEKSFDGGMPTVEPGE